MPLLPKTRKSREPDYKPLPKTLSRKSFDYRQISRDEHTAVYEQKHDSLVVGYELFLIRKQEATTMNMGGNEVQLEAKELFPSDNAFGTSAWSFRSLESAKKKLKQIYISNLLYIEVLRSAKSRTGDEYYELSKDTSENIWGLTDLPLYSKAHPSTLLSEFSQSSTFYAEKKLIDASFKKIQYV